MPLICMGSSLLTCQPPDSEMVLMCCLFTLHLCCQPQSVRAQYGFCNAGDPSSTFPQADTFPSAALNAIFRMLKHTSQSDVSHVCWAFCLCASHFPILHILTRAVSRLKFEIELLYDVSIN